LKAADAHLCEGGQRAGDPHRDPLGLQNSENRAWEVGRVHRRSEHAREARRPFEVEVGGVPGDRDDRHSVRAGLDLSEKPEAVAA
jgi:hypothetical protein